MNTNSAPSPKYTVLLPCRWGWFVGLKSDAFQTGSVATQGEWSPTESALCRSFLRPGDTVIDVGANVGNLTLAFAAAVGDTGRVISFEPQLFPYLCLCANVALNSLMHYVHPHQLAVGSEEGLIDVPSLDPTQKLMNFGGVSLLDEHTTPTAKVPVIKIDSLGLNSLRLIKADVEGMEPAVFRGAYNTIERFRPVIWTECLKDRGTRSDLAEIFKSLKYRAWLFATAIFDPYNVRLCRHNMYQIEGENEMQDHNVLALPHEAPVPDWINDKAEIICD